MTRLFWNWFDDPDPDSEVRVLHINGAIAGESWFDDGIASAIFNSGINAGSGDVMIWVNSPGGDVVAASAASVIAMAASPVAMSPVSMMMIHNPATWAIGDESELGRAIDMLA